MVQLMKLFLLALSMSGYLLNDRLWRRLRMVYRPAAVCALLSTVLFFCGLLNMLREAVWALYAAGFAQLVPALRRRPFPGARADCRRYGLALVFLLGVGHIVFMTRGAMLNSWDNMSHWGVVVKSMLRTDRLPNFQDRLIRFQAYPPGSSLFIYYVCKVTGESEAWMLMAHRLLQFSCMFAVTGLADRKRWYTIPLAGMLLIAGVGATSEFTYYDLYVDLLMPAVAVAALMIILAYRDDLSGVLPTLSLILCLLINVKQSAIYFYIVCLLMAVWHMRKTLRRDVGRLLGWGVALPMGSFVAWLRHTAYVFSDAGTSNHAMRYENYAAQMARKTPRDMLDIAAAWARKMLHIRSRTLLMLLVSFAVLAAIFLLARSRRNRAMARGAAGTFLMLAAVLLGYQIGMLGMYIFSMDTTSALNMGSYGRYELAGVIFAACALIGHCVIYLGALADGKPTGRGFRGMLALACCATVLAGATPLYLYREDVRSLVARQDPEHLGRRSRHRRTLQKAIASFGLEEGCRLLFYLDKTDAYFAMASSYELWTPDVFLTDDPGQVTSRAASFDYLLVWNNWEAVQDDFAPLGERIGTYEDKVCIRLADGGA